MTPPASVHTEVWLLWIMVGMVVVPLAISWSRGRLAPWITLVFLLGWYFFGISTLAGWKLLKNRWTPNGEYFHGDVDGLGWYLGNGEWLGLWPANDSFWQSPGWTVVSIFVGLASTRLVWKGLVGSGRSYSSHTPYYGSLPDGGVSGAFSADPLPSPNPPEAPEWKLHTMPPASLFPRDTAPAIVVTEEPISPKAMRRRDSVPHRNPAPLSPPPTPAPGPTTTPTPAGPIVFISYSSRDEAAARDFVTELEKKGLTCWYAARDITPGARGYHIRILDAIERSWLLVVLCSRDSVASSHVLNELEHATGLRRPMLPVLLEGFDPKELGDLSYFLKRFQMVRLPAPPGTVSRLAAGIARDLGIVS